jgi:branched-chain amino acid transport system ATP-binding protein
MLEATHLDTGYDRAQILFDVSLSVAPGEVVAVLGRNGAGKSTTLKTIAGLLRPWRGEIVFAGLRIDRLDAYRIARTGLGYVPETRRIFTSLSVAENLDVGRQGPRDALEPWTAQRIDALFPNLADLRGRRGGEISGGEQQMLAIARTLMGNPKLVLLDEPSEGLAPVVVHQLADAIRELRRQGISVLLSEQNFGLARGVADRAYVLERGHVRRADTMANFAGDRAAREQLLGME